MMRPVLVISLGAAAGALLRWQLGQGLNAFYPALPPGTLVANLLGGLIMGAAMGVFSLLPGLSPEWRLLVVTGFCGGLTTFSTFSAEVVTQLQSDRWGMAAAAIAIHVSGSLAMTLLGLFSVHWLAGR